MEEMTITNAKYIELEPGINISVNAEIDGVKMSVPVQVGNRHYDEIMRQVAAGTLTIQDAD